MFDRSKLESLRDVSVTRIGDTFPSVFRRLKFGEKSRFEVESGQAWQCSPNLTNETMIFRKKPFKLPLFITDYILTADCQLIGTRRKGL